MRAFAVELIFFSYDQEKRSQLFKIDPAGHFTGYFATSSGLKDQEAENKLELSFKEYNGFSKLKKDDLNWTHISDLAFWNSKSVEIFKFQGIPYNVLVNPEGIIVAESLRGEGLMAKLKEEIK